MYLVQCVEQVWTDHSGTSYLADPTDPLFLVPLYYTSAYLYLHVLHTVADWSEWTVISSTCPAACGGYGKTTYHREAVLLCQLSWHIFIGKKILKKWHTAKNVQNFHVEAILLQICDTILCACLTGSARTSPNAKEQSAPPRRWAVQTWGASAKVMSKLLGTVHLRQ